MFATSESSTSESATPPPCPTSPALSGASAPGPMTPPSADDNSVDCIFCLDNLPYDCVPATGQYQQVARLLPCAHHVHDECLKPWIEIANSCPICRINFTEVKVLPFVTGHALTTYEVEPKVQRVPEGGPIEIPPEVLQEPVIDPVTLARLRQEEYEEAVRRREDRRWESAWEHLDADLHQDASDEELDEDIYGWLERSREARMQRRARVAAAQAGDDNNAFRNHGGLENPRIWGIQTSRPREVFPHLQKPMSQEESESWKMMEIAEKIETTRKRRRSPATEQNLLNRIGISETSEQREDRRKFKRPRTKRDSQFTPLNTDVNNSEPSTANSAHEATAQMSAASPTGGLFSALLGDISKSRDIPIVSAADVHGRDLGRMRPMSPDRCSISSAMSQSSSPPPTFSPSPPSSRPNSPDRGRTLLPVSGIRTPAQSPERSSRRRAWEIPRNDDAMRKQPKEKYNSYDSAVAEPPTRNRPGTISSTTNTAQATDSNTRIKSYARAIASQKKADIMAMVKAALDPLYPKKITKEDYTNINQKVCRHLYKLVHDTKSEDKIEWEATITSEVAQEMEHL